LKLPPGKAYELYKLHGTCLKGLLEEGIIENSELVIDAFLDAVHDISLDDLKPDLGL
jgi:putative hydrolase of the HAD superfamily/pyrimidine and pyridine-specific 5'-nucleotidase